MLVSGKFWFGVAVGVGGIYAYHRWMKPLPTTKG